MFPTHRRPFFGAFVKSIYEKRNTTVISVNDDIFFKYVKLYCRSICSLLFIDRYSELHIHFAPLTAPFILFLPRTILTKTTLYYHGSDLFSSSDGLVMRWWKSIFLKLAIRRQVKICAPSRTFGSVMQSFGVTNLVSPHYGGGVDRVFFKEFGSCDRDIDIAIVGRLTQEKGIDDLIRIIELGEWPTLKWLICGDGPLKDKLKHTLIVKNQDVIDEPMQQREALSNFLRNTNIVLAPSKRESLGLVVLESLACGCQVLVRDLPIYGELVLTESLLRIVNWNDPKTLNQICDGDFYIKEAQRKRSSEAILKYSTMSVNL